MEAFSGPAQISVMSPTSAKVLKVERTGMANLRFATLQEPMLTAAALCTCDDFIVHDQEAKTGSLEDKSGVP